MKLAAIDIGTNAVRLLLTQVLGGDDPIFRKEALVRMPLRLGEDVFSKGGIGEEAAERLVETMEGYRHLIVAYPAAAYLAFATSAMREASNGHEVAEQVRLRTGIEIEIITGRREAEVICENHVERVLVPDRDYLYVDVGGGSTELALIRNGSVIQAESFGIGTVRILKEKVPPGEWDSMTAWLEQVAAQHPALEGIGSGGNINKIFKMARLKDGKPIRRAEIEAIRGRVAAYDPADRVRFLGLRPDRADVILPASTVYLTVMNAAGIRRMHVPQFGLSDGVVHMLYERMRARTATPPGTS